ncbi:DNA mismatch repair protein MutT [Loktanella sp. D2R18]|uniref:NUDIX hydrolase n=1 Tax=Rhodobacterales TaxID=204455 RepID=UPI000DE82548|nr:MULTISPECIES: NUDIX hydrolase [Rhodobacterales]MDO6589137.1 NUDIX hydrolase [Yoonia sp. 1_MG-2023]RBW45432.1 DNA mismatch repair protein MutT [Loktanella sp. D2R18]
MDLEWLANTKRLKAIADSGRHFARDPFDIERYTEISQIAIAMMARLADAPVAEIEGLLASSSEGYATPKIDVRGALIREGRILLVREHRDGVWSLPGGFADVGLSAAQNIRKEFLEEAGLSVEVLQLYALRHKAQNPYDSDLFDYYKLFFLCEAGDDQIPSTGLETTSVGFFTPDALPPLSHKRVLESDIKAAFACSADPGRAPLFD